MLSPLIATMAVLIALIALRKSHQPKTVEIRYVRAPQKLPDLPEFLRSPQLPHFIKQPEAPSDN